MASSSDSVDGQAELNEELRQAIENKDESGAISALERGADAQYTAELELNCARRSMLHLAVEHNASPAVVQTHLSHNADPDTGLQWFVGGDEPPPNEPPLVKAAQMGQEENVKVLLNYGASIDYTDLSGATAFYKAAENDHRDVLQVLWELGADPKMPDDRGITPAQAAERRGNNAITQWIKSLTKREKRAAKVLESGATYPNKRGLVLLFNFTFKGTKSERFGTDKDASNIDKTFKLLGYDVANYTDLNSSQMTSTLNRIAQSGMLWHYDSLIVFFCTHGQNKTFFLTSDNIRHDLDEVKKIFNSRNCIPMLNKPIILFGMFCRGDFVEALSYNYDALHRTVTRTFEDQTREVQIPVGQENEPELFVEVPRLANMTVIYASPDDVLTWSSESGGHFFVSCLCQKLEEYPTMELDDLLNETEKLLRSKGMPAPCRGETNYPFHKFIFKCSA